LTEPNLAAPQPSQFRKVPSDLAESLLGRGEWSLCAMEHSRIGPIEFEAPGVPFHHLALSLDRVPLRFGLKMDGRKRLGRNAPDVITTIQAGAGGTAMWDDMYESACLYFTTSSLSLALGFEVSESAHAVRTRVEHSAPDWVPLLHAFRADAAAGQPHGSLVGDAIFVALASRLVPSGDHRPSRGAKGEVWRVRRALEFVHANLSTALSIGKIADAAGTSPFYLNHAFRAALGCSIWQYVIRARARYSFALMADPGLNLTQISQLAGFDSYAGFIASVRREYGLTPARLRRSAGLSTHRGSAF